MFFFLFYTTTTTNKKKEPHSQVTTECKTQFNGATKNSTEEDDDDVFVIESDNVSCTIWKPVTGSSKLNFRSTRKREKNWRMQASAAIGLYPEDETLDIYDNPPTVGRKILKIVNLILVVVVVCFVIFLLYRRFFLI